MNMSLSIFGEKAFVPNEEMLAGTLAGSRALWGGMIQHVAEVCGSSSGEWKHYSKKSGWSFVVSSGKRKIIYLIPQEGFFKVYYVLGDRAVAAAGAAGLPDWVLSLLAEATPYVEGRVLMFDVKTDADADIAKKLVGIKHFN
jgi:hypothetical protein